MTNSNIEQIKHEIFASVRLGFPLSPKQEAYYLLFIADRAAAYKYHTAMKKRISK